MRLETGFGRSEGIDVIFDRHFGTEEIILD